MTLVNRATRYAGATPLRRIDAETVAEALLQTCLYVRFPIYVTTDNSTNFTSRHFRVFTEFMAARHKLTPPYHAQSNGIVERFNGTLKVMLHKLANERPRDWNLCIPPLFLRVS